MTGLMVMKRVSLLIVVLITPAVVTSAEGSSPLKGPCPVDWRGERLGEALPELAGRLAVPYILDASVDAVALAARVRMSARHLTGEQAFRWPPRNDFLPSGGRPGRNRPTPGGRLMMPAEPRLTTDERTSAGLIPR